MGRAASRVVVLDRGFHSDRVDAPDLQVGSQAAENVDVRDDLSGSTQVLNARIE